MRKLLVRLFEVVGSAVALIFFVPGGCLAQGTTAQLRLNDREYYEARGLNVLVFSNWYDGNFSDAKISGIEIIHHGVRTATNGDVRLNPTPEQWDSLPKFVRRTINRETNSIEASLSYPHYGFEYTIKTESVKEGILISVHFQKPLPPGLEGRAGLNLEFLPSAYFEKGYIMDGKSGIFPLYPGGPMEQTPWGTVEPKPIVTGRQIVFAPEDPERHVTISGIDGTIALYDGRNKAQNGWFVVRSLLPSGTTGTVLRWLLTATTIPGWKRAPMIAHSQLGYHPQQNKIGVIEFDANDSLHTAARLLKVTERGEYKVTYTASLQPWGTYLRYRYARFDFSPVSESGLYIIEYDTLHTKPFRIDQDVYRSAWHPTLDVFFPVQMDHMFVNEAYRVWHGASHLDDALQAPVNHLHFDLYAQGPTTDSPYTPGEHIPGLNIGGWYDAGDHDIRTQTQYQTVLSLVYTWEAFKPTRDQTTIDQQRRYVDIHMPDRKPDVLQQIEHGTLALIAQHRSIGHAIPGIIVSSLSQYTHLGDAITITDNLVYAPALKSSSADGLTSSTYDDRWAFTTKSTPLNYGSIAALAAASRVLRGFNDTLAEECLATAIRVWDEEQTHPPNIFSHGNTTGGRLEDEALKAAVELLICTRNATYAKRIHELLPAIENRFSLNAVPALRALPFMDEGFKKQIESFAHNYNRTLSDLIKQNPFGVPITTTGWAGGGTVMGFALTTYHLHKVFPHLIDKEHVFAGLNYLYGCHPGSNTSFVSGVGTVSKRVAYGNNRADFSFIAGGIVPGVLILKPDFPESKDDWPFLWGENEYVINMGSSYIFLVNAVNDLLNNR
ncbi:MAG: glycoside hydrolase family 9 protein [bacterium]